MDCRKKNLFLFFPEICSTRTVWAVGTLPDITHDRLFPYRMAKSPFSHLNQVNREQKRQMSKHCGSIDAVRTTYR